MDFSRAKRVVVKVGTSTLTHKTGLLNLRKVEELCKILCDLQNSGREMILVSSGAVSAGWNKMGLSHRPQNIEEKQAAAAVGQGELMNLYNRNMLPYGHTIAQILLTKDVVDNDERRHNAENVFRLLLEKRCIPIVNENDSVSSEGVKFGDNDTLSAYVADLAKAELLIILSDVDGLYDGNPQENPDAHLIPVVSDISAVKPAAAGAGTERGTGGMLAKLEAASHVSQIGIPMIVANGADPSILYRLLENEEVPCTLFLPAGERR